MSPPPSARGAGRRDPEPSEPLGSGPRVKTCSSSCLSWLHPLRSWSLRQTRGGSVFEKESAAGSATSTIVSNFSYAPTGDVSSIQFGNGTVTTNSYNPGALYRLSNKVTTLPSSTHAQDLTYSYDALGNITQVVDASNSATAKTIGY